MDLVDRARTQAESPLSLGEALAVLLFTWNRAYYQYHPARPEHVSEIERLLVRHADVLADWRTSRISGMSSSDEARIVTSFVKFESLLGSVGAAKGLHLLAPEFLPIRWTIASAYSCGLGNRGSNGAVTCGSCESQRINAGCSSRTLKPH